MVVHEFVEQLQAQLERHMQIKERLDGKANNIIMMSGTVATLFMGFGIFLLEHVDYSQHHTLTPLASGALGVEVVSTAITIILAFHSYRSRVYEHPIVYERFYDKDKDSFDTETTSLFASANKEEIDDAFVRNYLICIRSWEDQNHDQSRDIDKSRIFFMVSIFMIPLFSIAVILTKFI